MKEKLKAGLELGKEFYSKHEEAIEKYLNLTREIATDTHSIIGNIKNPGVSSYINLAFKIKESGKKYIKTSKINKEEISNVLEFGAIQMYVYSLLEENGYINKNTPKWANDERYQILTVDNCRFLTYNRHIPFCFEKDTEKARQIMRDLHWKKSNIFSIGSQSYKPCLSKQKPKKVFPNKKTQQLIENLQKFSNKKINRSLLLYGAPGTGKSNIAADIIQQLKYKTFILEPKILNEDVNYLNRVIWVFKPDAILLEDIDHDQTSSAQALAFLEGCKDVKLVIATCNSPKILNSALIRPGRFDELIEIDKLDDEVLFKIVNEDQEIFELVKDLPIAYIQELMNRISALGREQALASFEDIQKRYQKSKDIDYGF